MKTIQRGEVHWVQLDPARGSEMAKRRPCVVLSPREINDHRRTVVVVPLTTTETPAMFPLLVHTPSIGANSKVRTEHIRAIDGCQATSPISGPMICKRSTAHCAKCCPSSPCQPELKLESDPNSKTLTA